MKYFPAALGLALAVLGTAVYAQGVPKLDDPNTVVTVMQFSARNAAARPQLEQRMGQIRDYVRKQPGYIDNALMENRNTGAKPEFVGVSRWKSERMDPRRVKLRRYLEQEVLFPAAERRRRGL